MLSRKNWRGVRVVDGARLESVYTCKRIEGSNPFLSAETSFKIIQNLENLMFFGVFSFNTLPKYSFFIINQGAKSRP